METKNIILKLRTERGMSQDELADKIMVTRQAVSRWENGDTVPNTDTLKLLSKEFDVSINTLLGEPRKLICQCCGMPIDDDSILGRDKDGTLNEEYCKWCYADGTYTYNDMDELIDVCVKNMVNENFTEEQARSYLKEMLPKLDYWKRYDELSDNGQFEEFKKQLINEINDLHIDGLPRVDKLNALVGKYVNLEYKNCQCFAVMATWKTEMRWRRRRSRRLRHVKCCIYKIRLLTICAMAAGVSCIPPSSHFKNTL